MNLPQNGSLDFTAYMGSVCSDMTQRVAALSHIRMEDVLISFSQTRSSSIYGTYAHVVPLRFKNGALEEVRRGHRYGCQKVRHNGRDVLYILSFFMPRFFNLGFQEKLTTVVHELWHISPDFNGDIRHFPGSRFGHSCSGHGTSKKAYNDNARRIAQLWLNLGPPRDLYELLHLNYSQLVERYPRIYGTRAVVPKLIRLD